MAMQVQKKESERIAALRKCAILDSPAERTFDSLVAIAATVCGARYAAIRFVEEDRVWTKASHGFPAGELRRADALCSLAIQQAEPMMVEDLDQAEGGPIDSLPATGLERIRFYAGVRIVSSDGQALGALCVLDTVPRRLDASQLEMLGALTGAIADRLELRRQQLGTDWKSQELDLAYSSLARAHARLQDHQDQLVRSEKLAVLGEMAVSIVHEINNPLVALQLETAVARNLLEADARTDAKERREVLSSLVAVEDTAFRISRIIKSTRSFARQAEKDPFLPHPVRNIVESALQLCEKRIAQQGVRLSRPAIPESLQLECRESELSQVLVNLLKNAADAVAALPDKWICVECRIVGSSLELAVMDSGSGVPESIRRNLFQPFFSTKGPGSGTGLGLSISRRILEDHSGTLVLDTSAPHTRFVCTLPLRREAMTESPGVIFR